MKKVLLSIGLFAATLSLAFAQSTYPYQSTTTVEGYTKQNGTVVESHTRTKPNETNWDNYSTSPNTNPYTGTTGTKAPDYSSQSQSNQSNHDVQTGPRGGQYYINSNGNKTYVPKSR